jgi:hypothetical protein
MVIVFRLTLSSTITSNYGKYGSAGVVFAIMTLLIAIGVVIVLGALLGVAWRERQKHQPDSSAARAELMAGKSSCSRAVGQPSELATRRILTIRAADGTTWPEM